VLKRFASVIDLTFKRYFDLQIAEGSAREAKKQAALDRIRAEIASMRTINDLERITPLIWSELTILNIPFIRCGVFIMDEKQQLTHTFLSTPEGKAIAAFHLPFQTPGNIAQVLLHWRSKKIYTDHWDEAAFREFANSLVTLGALGSAEQYLSTLPVGGFYLHFLPFQQGMLYVGNTNQLGEEDMDLLQSVANAFSTAYARYEDFKKLEAAKEQVDHTLTELQGTQKQLIQSEKMASLGELTAGIAHEIQNPLNFVNNFAEVNEELIAELLEEVRNGNTTDILSLATAVDENLKKIIQHGRRADSIVKGMLQHSRTDTGKKEKTDINALADEYLRLSYHGLRARDKTFNALFELQLDPGLQPVAVVPQEIGRVLLNLFNNAFYAVNEKKKSAGNGYEPVVSVSTKALGKEVLITVKDNGSGIPASAMDKIFQPFFTTKPTGQGTGLGLSLSYDIVKAHGGELKVATQEGAGTQFSFELATT
jgi:signal transduction histidine kinase